MWWCAQRSAGGPAAHPPPERDGLARSAFGAASLRRPGGGYMEVNLLSAATKLTVNKSRQRNKSGVTRRKCGTAGKGSATPGRLYCCGYRKVTALRLHGVDWASERAGSL